MEGGGRVSESIINGLHCSDIQRDQMRGERGVTRSIIDQYNS